MRTLAILMDTTIERTHTVPVVASASESDLIRLLTCSTFDRFSVVVTPLSLGYGRHRLTPHVVSANA